MGAQVWKFPLEVRDEQWIEMPVGAELLFVGVQRLPLKREPMVLGETLAVWARVDPDATKVRRGFRVSGTGHDLTGEHAYAPYVGSALMEGGRLVMHVFDLAQRETLEP